MATLSFDSGTQMDLTNVYCGYLSNISDSEESDISDHGVDSKANASHDLHEYGPTTLCSVSTGQWLPAVPPLKHHWLEVSFCVQCKISASEHQVMQEKALEVSESCWNCQRLCLLEDHMDCRWNRHEPSRATWHWLFKKSIMLFQHQRWLPSVMGLQHHGEDIKFAAGPRLGFLNKLSQFHWPAAIQKYIHCLMIQRSLWNCIHMCTQTSGLWMDRNSLTFQKTNLSQWRQRSICSVIQDKMPQGLKHYMDLVLFPQIHVKVEKGISLATA